nr:hypothetical protein B0A51_07672 [Rachicladosporium sp. CCFEE 5018]
MGPKRKRAPTLTNPSDEAIPQPSSRDASASDTADPILSEVHERRSIDPPSKRTRSSRPPTSESNNGSAEALNGTAGAAASSANGTVNEAGEHGEAGKMRMEPPPKAGLVDPEGGYKTNKPPEGRSVRVYADGVFDLFHLGHMRALQQAKTAFPDTYLIVGVTGDSETHKRKGLTVLSAKERAESVRHCRWVDEVVEDCPWIITVGFLDKHQIDYVAHDDLPYGASEGDDIYGPIKEAGKFLVTQRTEGVSTTGIITKIVRDYEQYVGRQLRRGTTRQELNVSWFKKNELDIKRHVGELRDNIRQNWTTTGQELSKELKQFWQPSRQNSPAPSLRSMTPGRASGAKSPLALDRLNPMDAASILRGSTPGGKERGRNYDFAAGYAMGLIGGVKGWMQGSRRSNLSDSRAESPSSEGDSGDAKSPTGEFGRGRRGRSEMGEGDEVIDEERAKRQLEVEIREA